MPAKVLFAQVLHSHQPVGNFDHVFERACEQAYAPYVEEYLRTGRFPVSLHFSGPLLEWLEENRHPLLELLRRAAAECDVEFVGGGWYEPILTMLPGRDARGQLAGGARLVERLLGARPRGAWITERVWEQNLASLLVESGYRYATLDDSHFAHAGLDPARLGPYYWAEDDGRLLAVFPASERLRYLIPFGSVEEVVAELRSHLPEEGLALVVYADDGEKFGLWPGTNKHVYRDGWLARYHAGLLAEGDWLEPVTLSTGFERLRPEGLVYLGDDSYREMTEWVLPAEAQAEFLDAAKELDGDARFERLRRFFRGGTWRAFKAKYSELRRMYARMLAVSAEVDVLPEKTAGRARRELYRAQCNCAWWHGVFGGVYMPHLRGAVWKHLLAAERLAGRAGSARRRPAVERADFDLDGREELRLSTSQLSAFLAPERGGHLFELDRVPADLNLTDVLTRRPEAYHREIRRLLAAGGDGGGADGSVSIHDLQREATAEHGAHLVYDAAPLESLVDRVIPGSWSVDELWREAPAAEEGFLTGEYEVSASKRSARAVMTRSGPVAGRGPLELTKTVSLRGGRLEASYRLRNLGGEKLAFTFGTELNLSADFPQPEGGRPRGPEVLFYEDAGHMLSACTPAGTCVRMLAPGAAAAAWQVKTVSQSETSYEVCVQGLGAFVWWYLRLAPGDAAEKSLALSVEDA
ncbi:MAG: alpha-amylase/4-alpha-glucanotransferase domain-containing protein [Planctomycetota bacterium]